MTSPLAFSRVFLSSTRMANVSALLAMGIVGLLATVVGRSPVAAAADLVWVGNDDFNNSDFASSGNWQGNTLPSWGFTNSLKFNQNQNSNVTGLNYNWGDWRSVNDILWDSSFPVARTLSASNGGGIDFRTRIENNSSFTQTVAMNLSGGKDGASDIQLNPVKGSLTLSGTIYNDNSLDYTVYGNDTGITTFLTLNTALGPNAPTQANVDFTVASGRDTAVQVNASQVWSGTTDVQSGSFTTANGVTLASTAIIVGGGTVTTTSANTFADTASLTVNTGRISIAGSDTVASLAGSGGVVNVASGATLTFGGTGSTSYAGSIIGSGNLTKVGSGTFTVTSASTLSGTARVTAGQLTVGAANLLADTVSVVVDGGVLSFNGSDTIGSLAGTAGTVAIGANSLTVSQSSTTTYAGAVTGNGTFTKTGSGILTLTGNAAAYAGATQVQAGTVVVNGSLGGSVDVSLGATLSGTGTIGGNASIAGTQAPGGAGVVGTQTINGNLTYAAGSILSWDLFANNASLGSYDQISVPNGDLTFSGATAVAMSFNGAGSAVAWSNSFWNVSRSWLVQDLGTGVMNNFSNLSISSQNWLDSTGAAFNTARPGSSFSVTQQGQDMLITYVVPEPSTIVALIGGLAGVAGFSIRRRRGC